MPSTSKAQQRFMGLVHAYKKGEVKGSEVSKAIKKAAKSMKKSSTKKYASTKHTDLPDKVKEDRDYKEEYKKYGSSTKSKKYRAELNQYNRKKGTYGNGDGKDASHKGGKIVGFESQSKNRGRAEKSRLKKESSAAYGKSIEKIANDRKLKSISKKDRGLLLKIAKLMKKANESVNEGRKWSMHVDGKKIKTYTSKRAAVIAHNKFMKDTDNWKEVSIQAESINEKTVSIGGEELLKFLMKRFKMSKSQAIASMKKHKMDMSFLKNESVNEMVKPGDVFQDYYKKGVEIAVEKSMGKWKTVSFNLKTMSAHEVGTNNTLEKQKSMKLSSSDKMKIKKIVKNPQEADYINQDDSNMAKKLLRVLNEAFKKESVKESIQLPHGMELGKVFTGHGKSFVKEESVNEDVGVETILGGIVQAIQKAGLKPKSAKLMKSGFKVSKRDKVGFVIDVEIRGFDKKEIHKMQFEVERGMLYLILNNKPVKLGKWTMGTMVTKNLKKIALTLSGQKGSPKRIA